MLKEQIQSDLNEAIKNGNEVSRNTLRLLLAAFLSKEKDKRYNISKQEPELIEEELADRAKLTDEEIGEVIFSEVKKRKEAISEYQKGKREDLVEKEKAELEILEEYLPEQISPEELEKLTKQVIDKVKAQDIKDTGKVMAELMPQVKGRADGTEVSKIVKELLSNLDKVE